MLETTNIKPADFECNWPDFKFCGIGCKHIYCVCQKFYPVQIPEVSYTQEIQEIEELEQIVNVSFDDWVTAIRRVWDNHDQENRNLITAANMEVIVSTGIKRKSKIPLYDNFSIPGSR
ncbi:34634_t:CDS:1 [Gigaspora margarita]|uniref:34634_t:CDS:1 n=1 Tax=Gigaspora margarita TaxID=4874 RepID=A0ABN7UKU5_GIGMA|nr:34634_t:CDS:1 [Gigaspora margarita]